MFVCNDCGASAPRWQGRCPRCGAWAALEAKGEVPKRQRDLPRPVPIGQVVTGTIERRPTGYAEVDRVLGGGAVPGSAVLIGGEPGIGKSTLLLGLCARIDGATLYVTGEEAPDQVVLRARRLGMEGAAGLRLLDSTDTQAVAATLLAERPALCVVDSIQTMRCSDVDGAPGGPAQVRAAAEHLVPAARQSKTCLVLIGQVTKVGGLAGPRTVEHAVDAVLLFEGDRQLSVRALRAVKNRFGPTDEIGLFEMRADGLHEVRDASGLLLSDRTQTGPGSVVAAAMEGRRALCVEVQALVVGENKGIPRRRAQGVDQRRLELLVGVSEALFSGGLSGRDVFVNVVGGLTVRDTALDLAVCAAVLGAHWGTAVEPGAIVMGEVGLRGEVRSVPQPLARLKEARAMGFSKAYVPAGSPSLEGIETIAVERVSEVLKPVGSSESSQIA